MLSLCGHLPAYGTEQSSKGRCPRTREGETCVRAQVRAIGIMLTAAAPLATENQSVTWILPSLEGDMREELDL